MLDDVCKKGCKSDKLRFPSLSFYKVSSQMGKNSEELLLELQEARRS